MKILEYFNERIRKIALNNDFGTINNYKYNRTSVTLGTIEISLNNGEYRHKGNGYKVTLEFLDEKLASPFLEGGNPKIEILSGKDVISIEKFANLLFEINNYDLQEEIILISKKISAIQVETPKYMGARLDKNFADYKVVIWYDKDEELYKKLFTNETKEELIDDIKDFFNKL